MAKSIKRPKAFQIPTIEEVEKFMNEAKPDWPAAFCARMARKFWFANQGKGWQYGGRLMKDWHAVFWNNWHELKYPEDVKALDEALKSWQHKVLQDERRRKSAGLFAVAEGPGPSPFDRWLEQMDGIYAAWMVGNAKDSQLREVGDWLRSEKMLLLPKVQQEQIIADAGNNGDLRVLLAIRQFFCNLKAKDLTPSSFVRSRIETAKSKTA
jgi:hypothetical protein